MMHLATSHTHPLRPAPFHDPQVNTTDQPFAFRQLLVDFCGPKWTEELVPATCCSYSQLQTLEASLAAARQFVASCPACWTNCLVRRRPEGTRREGEKEGGREGG